MLGLLGWPCLGLASPGLSLSLACVALPWLINNNSPPAFGGWRRFAPRLLLLLSQGKARQAKLRDKPGEAKPRQGKPSKPSIYKVYLFIYKVYLFIYIYIYIYIYKVYLFINKVYLFISKVYLFIYKVYLFILI